MNKIKAMLPYLLACAAAFYILPLFGKDTGSYMLILLFLIPIVCFFSGLLYGRKHSLGLAFTALIALIFIPSIFIFYNSSAFIYTLIFSGAALAGFLFGYFILKNRK